MSVNSTIRSVPTFRLYEQAANEDELSILHWEALASRSGLHNWEIRAHRHRGLHQIFLIESGGGEAVIDEMMTSFHAPCLIAIPPLMVHGFRFNPGAQGHVVTAPDDLVTQLAGLFGASDVPDMMSAPRVLDVSDGFDRLRLAFEALAVEFHVRDPWRSSALAARLGSVLIEIARLQPSPADAKGPDATPSSALFRAFGMLAQQHAVEHWGIGDYAAALACTKARLTAVCQRLAGRSPLQIVHDRLLLEAKRSLIYTSMSVGEISYALGFKDAAYFCRFFARHEGEPPSNFRRRWEVQRSPGSLADAL